MQGPCGGSESGKKDGLNAEESACLRERDGRSTEAECPRSEWAGGIVQGLLLPSFVLRAMGRP